MITNLKPYSAYRHSEVEWLGEVPEGWEVLPARSLFGEIIQRNHPEEEMLSVTIRDGVIPQADLLEDTQSKDGSNLDRSSYKLVLPEDLVYNKMRAWQGAAGRSPARGIVSPAYIVMRSRGAIKPAYAHSLLRTPNFAKEAERWSYGITSDQWSLRSKDFKQIYFPVPPVASQIAISRFLSHVDLRIQRLIEAKERLIRLLQEEKQEVIDRALSRGLDFNASLSPSGVDWLGDVPEGWKVMRLKFLARIGTRLVDPRLPEYIDKVLIAPNHVQSATGQLLFQESARQQGAESGKYIVRKEELVYSKIRPALRKAVISPVEGLCSADMYPVAVRDSVIDSCYLLKVMLSKPFTQYVVDCSLRVAMPKVNREALGDAWIAFPPLSEQRKILKWLAGESEGPNETIQCAQRQVSLLREYRSRIVSDVVTGKLDVRKAAEQLPDEPDRGDLVLDERLEEVAAA